MEGLKSRSQDIVKKMKMMKRELHDISESKHRLAESTSMKPKEREYGNSTKRHYEPGEQMRWCGVDTKQMKGLVLEITTDKSRKLRRA